MSARVLADDRQTFAWGTHKRKFCALLRSKMSARVLADDRQTIIWGTHKPEVLSGFAKQNVRPSIGGQAPNDHLGHAQTGSFEWFCEAKLLSCFLTAK